MNRVFACGKKYAQGTLPHGCGHNLCGSQLALSSLPTLLYVV